MTFRVQLDTEALARVHAGSMVDSRTVGKIEWRGGLEKLQAPVGCSCGGGPKLCMCRRLK